MNLNIIILIYIGFIHISISSSSIILNVQKILLPIHSSVITNFTLNATSELEPDTDDLCIEWSSSRPEIVSITPIYENRNTKFNGYDCSHRAIVSARSKHSQRMTSIISAEDIKTNKKIHCEAIVDQIHSIRIKHTTIHLYLEHSPEILTAEALDSESNIFTSIDGLPFEWKVFNETTLNDSRKELRIAKFIDSEYNVSDSIKQLESLGLHGHKISIEGINTGLTRVQATYINSHSKDSLKTPPVQLLVVAKILIKPSGPIYLLSGTSIRLSAYFNRQKSSDEKIFLPSEQFYFESFRCSVADFDKKSSSKDQLEANELGETQIILNDRYIDEKLYKDLGLKPPSVLVHVVRAKNLSFSLKNWRSWILESGREYQIEIVLHTKDGNLIYSADNLRIESEFPKFSVRDRSQNGSYVVAKTVEKGIALITGEYDPSRQSSSNLKESKVRGEQKVEIFDPISIQPEILVFAHTPNEVFYEYFLQVTGGSGSYFYQTKDISIATVDSHGLLKVNSNKLGESKILANDRRNFDIKSESKMMVVEPVSIFLDPCPVEALVKSRLEISVKMNGLMQDGSMVSINDCSKISFNVIIQDETVFKYIEVANADSMGQNCAKIILDAEKVGETLIQVFYGELKSQEMKIFSLSQLTSLKKNLLLAKSSSYLFSLSDGPFLNSDMHSYESEFRVNPHHLVNVEHLKHDSLASKYTYRITCLDTNDFENEIEFTIWNKATSQNKCPIKFQYKLAVSCLRPTILELSQLFVNNEDSKQEIYSSMKWRCPIKLNSKFAVANLNRDLNIQLLVKDSNGKEFDNFTSLKSVWKFDSHFMSKPKEVKFMSLKPIDQNTLAKETNIGYHTLFYQSLVPKKKAGETKIELKLFTDENNYLENFLSIRFVNDVRVEPTELVLFNHPSNIQQLKLFDGSGYFHAEVESKEKSLLKINHIWDSGIQVSPLTSNGLCFINVFDYCMPPQSFDLSRDEFSWEPTARSSVKVAGINSILVNFEDDKVQVGQQIKAFVQIVDASGNFIHSNYFKLMNLEAKIDSELSLFKIDSLNQVDETNNSRMYSITGLKKGSGKISFEIRSNDNVIKSMPVNIEIYEPIKLESKMVEIILGTYYQIRYTGGPVFSHDINIEYQTFEKDVINVNGIGLVNGLALGSAKVNIKFTTSKKLLFQDSIEFKIVEAKFVKIRSPLTSVKSGNKFPLHILLNNLNPFYFATSKNIQYKWSLNDVALAEILRNDGFSVHVRTKKPGLLRISVSVFYMDKEFLDSVEMKILAPAIFSNFGQQVPPDNMILVTGKTMLQLRTNYDSLSSEIKYSLQFGMEENECSGSKVQLSSDGLLKVSDPRTECFVGIQASVHYQSKIQILNYLIQIKEISYRMFRVDEQNFSVTYHDNLGDEFFVVNTKSFLKVNLNNLVELIQIDQNVFGAGPSISFLSDSKINSFRMNFLNDGYLILELYADHANDFIGLDTSYLKNKISELYVGDLICKFASEQNSIVKLAKSPCCNIGVAFESGRIALENKKEYLVHDFADVYFKNKENILTNALNFDGTSKATDHAVFTLNPYGLISECSDDLERIYTEDLSPFDCHATLYNANDEQISYLDRLIKTKVLFKNKNWICKVIFEPNSDSALYDLILSNSDGFILSNHLKHEPDRIKFEIYPRNKKWNQIDSGFHVFKFVPAFYVQSKIIDLDKKSNSNLVIKLTSFMKSNIKVTTNIPRLISIKEIESKDFTMIYKVEKKSNLDFDEFFQILKINDGKLYVQILEIQTQQVEKIPIKLVKEDFEHELSKEKEKKLGRCSSVKNSTQFFNLKITKLLASILLIFLGVLAYYKLWPNINNQ